jgi:hypothetical protein
MNKEDHTGNPTDAADPSGRDRSLVDLSEMPYRLRRPARLRRAGKWLFGPFLQAKLAVGLADRFIRATLADRRENSGGAPSRLIARFAGSASISGAGRSVAIYAHYSPQSSVSSMVAYQVREYARLGFRVVFVSASPRFTASDFAPLRDSVEVAIHRRNFGLDFGSWSDALSLLPDLAQGVDELLLVNDSVLGPIVPLDGVFTKMREGGEGLYGMTDSIQHAPHVQSYFLLARGGAVIADLVSFLRSTRLSISKQRVVKRFEIGLSGHMRSRGHRVAALWNYEDIEEELLRSDQDVQALIASLPASRLPAGGAGLRRRLLDLPLNPVHHFAGLLVRRCGFPFIKTELVQKNPERVLDAVQWRSMVPGSSYVPLSVLEEHLASLERPLRRSDFGFQVPSPPAGVSAADTGEGSVPASVHAAGKATDSAQSVRQYQKPWQFTLSEAWTRAASPVQKTHSGKPNLKLRKLADALPRSSFVISFSHDDYAAHTGGVQNVIHLEQLAFAKQGTGYLHLSPLVSRAGLAPAGEVLFGVRLNGKRLGTASLHDLRLALTEAAQRNGVLATIVHHFSGHAPEDILALHDAAAARQAIVWLHDFSTLCSNPLLMRNDIAFCGGPDLMSSACGVCVHGSSRAGHMKRLLAFFETVKPEFLAPSQIALSFWQERIGLAESVSLEAAVVPPLRIMPFPGARQSHGRLRRKVLVAHIGTRTYQKGWLAFAGLAEQLAGDERYEFLQLGLDLGHPLTAHVRHVPVEVGPDCMTAMADAVAAEGVDVAVNWSQCYETFCFTAHEALAGGAFLLTHPRAGNIPSVISGNAPGQGLVIEDEKALLNFFRSGDLHQALQKGSRSRHLMVFGGATAEWPLARSSSSLVRSMDANV